MTNDLPTLSGPEFGPASGGKPKQLVILCHGLGADGNDLIGLAPHYAKVLPNAMFVSPNAPFQCDMSPFGYQWFSLQERTEEAMLAGAQKAQPILDAFIDQQLAKYKLTERNLALVGFSQGTMVSIFTVPRRKIPVAGVVAYSGRLIGKDLMAQEICCNPPMVMINGDQDELVPVTLQPAAVDTLRALGVKIEGHIRPGLGHSIDDVGIKIAQDFLSALF
jgi:phospholipase/carboxylesterase